MFGVNIVLKGNMEGIYLSLSVAKGEVLFKPFQFQFIETVNARCKYNNI